MSPTLLDDLRQTLDRYELVVGDKALDQIAEYVERLWAWNEKVNLTRHTTVEKFVARDLFDVVQLAKLIGVGSTVLDMGTGGGVPGVPLAILRPDLEVSLSESIGKKARVVDDIVLGLGLPVSVHASRAEVVLADHRFDFLVARGVGSLLKICRWLEPHWANIGGLLAIKGPKWVDERNEARHLGVMKGLQLRKAVEYKTPGDDPRYSVILQVTGVSPPASSEARNR